MFLVKSPLYLFHFWLPKAHVEASLIGSMVLAGILLKLGGFGLYRFINLLSLKTTNNFFFFFRFGFVFSALICLFHRDFKSIIAYSRVNHITLIVIAIFLLNNFSIKGAVFIIICHGILSPLIFYSINIFYYHTLSRTFYFSQGILFLSKSLSLLIFIIFSLNLNIPIFFPFLREFLLLFGIFSVRKRFIIIFIISSLFSCYYRVFIMVNLLYGKQKKSNSPFVTSIQTQITLRFGLLILITYLIVISII